jgi:hypothetical protein
MVCLTSRQLDLFWQKVAVEPNTGCWLWIANTHCTGYGMYTVKVDGKKITFRAHRLSYMLRNGNISDELVLDHLCRQRCCVNPDHLEQVPQSVNSARGEYAQKTHCINGHVFDEKNTYRPARGGRECRTCRREFMRRTAETRRTDRDADDDEQATTTTP